VFPGYTYNDHLETEIEVGDIERILNCPVGRDELDFAGYVQSSPTREGILGLWNGFTYRVVSSKEPNAGMISMTLCPREGDNRAFCASGRCDLKEFTIFGECTETDKVIIVTFKREISGRTQYWSGRSDAATVDDPVGTITGTWGSKPDPTTHRGIFILKRIAPEVLRFRPAPAIFDAGKAHALWVYATSVHLYEARQKLWAKSYFSERQESKRRFLELYKRRTRFNCSVDDSDEEEFRRIRNTLTPADSRLYRSQAEFEIERVTGYMYVRIQCA